MNEAVHHYIRAKNIDSFQKLRLLLFLYQNPRLKVTSQELAHRLHLGDTLLIETLLADLHQAGLVIQMGIYYQLADEPEVRFQLQQLASAFEHPVTRQELLKQVKPTPIPRSHPETGFQRRWLFELSSQ
ncbi:MAG: hypothetical protein DPW09_13945 [Anaerolineae bacterium]|nr:hypothetical protein [Anaerolineales bacterium]MCQ3974539.1 hypothetical protein [Anaerolineae bacterium]